MYVVRSARVGGLGVVALYSHPASNTLCGGGISKLKYIVSSVHLCFDANGLCDFCVGYLAQILYMYVLVRNPANG